ncbi:hypothetical protein DFP72DRAFT_868272 [Ephemerocybe angulata]|uniref:CCHC-type domain-containing protein n=1 Tax=Ephemerocybe angulata TaxID=980116 RepID=A0A8H6IJT3_9AGAR|nr:hypothetical protein DFP72DRAFT_868272 [Tulosesus angulatus]
MEKLLVMMLQQMRKDREEERKDREADRAEREEYRTHLADLMDRFSSNASPNQDDPPIPPPVPVFNVNCEARTPPWAFDLKQFSGSAEDVQSHLAVCELAFDADLPRVLTNRQKILLSLKYCSEGAAKPWYDSCVASLSSGAWATKTWQEYKAMFTVTFGDQFLQDDARRQLETTVKDPNESAASFFLRYDNLRVKAGIASPFYDVSCIQAARLRLPHKLVRKIGNDVISYDLFRQRVINEDNERREGDKADAHYAARTNALLKDIPPHLSKGSWRSSNPPAIRTPALPTPTATIAPKEAPLALPAPPAPAVSTATEFTGICYKCGQRGHRRPECPNPAKATKISVVLDKVVDALEEGGREEYAEELVRALSEADADFGDGEL